MLVALDFNMFSLRFQRFFFAAAAVVVATAQTGLVTLDPHTTYTHRG